MIYLRNNTSRQLLNIPTPETKVDGLLNLQLTSIADKTIIYDDVVIQHGTRRLHYSIDFILPENINSGEYHYCLSQDNVILCNGILAIINRKRKYKYSESKEFVQYEK